MTSLRILLVRLAAIFRKRKLDQELDAEIRSHLEMQTEDNFRAGMDPVEARQAALRSFRGVEQVKERYRDLRGMPAIESIFQDIRYAARRLRSTPAFTIVVLLTLAIGIGANTAIFSVINGILLRPLAYPEAEQLFIVEHTSFGGETLASSAATYFTYREENQSFQEFGVYSVGAATVTGLTEPERVQTVNVAYGTLQALRVQPVLGRWFSEAEQTPGTPETVLLTHGYWQRRFGGDPLVVGESVTVDVRPRKIIGVMPETFRFLDANADLILPLRFDRNRVSLGNFNVPGLARLKPGVTPEQAHADIERMIAIWLDAWPVPPVVDPQFFVNAGFAPKLTALQQYVVGDVGNTLWVLMGTIGIVLLIACMNVANMLLVRAEGRQQELAVRAALGAGWGRIARAMLVESVLLGLLGGALGLALAYPGLRLLVAIGPGMLPRLGEIGIDPAALAFTVSVSLLTGLLFGLAPVLKYAGTQLAAGLRAGGRSLSDSRERRRTRNALVVVQMALALVLVIGSGLMIRSFQALRAVEPGFTDPASVQMLRISIPQAQIQETGQVIRLQNEIVDELAAIPGVRSVSFGSAAPMDGFSFNDILSVEDKTYEAGEVQSLRGQVFTAPGYFQTLGTALIAGRDFTWTDLYDRRNVAIVSENLAREIWGPPEAALGKRIRQHSGVPWREVIGVVGDIYHRGAHEEAPKTVYWRVLDETFGGHDASGRSVTFLIRTDRAATEAFLEEVRQAVWSVNNQLPLIQVRTLDDAYTQSMARTSVTLVMLAIAGAMALLLGVVGIYGVIAYAVSQRTREIGIRMALGARTAGLVWRFVGQVLLLAGIGVAIGLPAAAGLTRLMQSLLFETSPLDPVTYAAAAVALLSTAALAGYLPARRVTGVDPGQTLRGE